MRTSSMIMLILISANFLNFIMDSIGLAETLYQFVNNLGAFLLYTLIVVIALYIVLGFFVETLSHGHYRSHRRPNLGEPGL